MKPFHIIVMFLCLVLGFPLQSKAEIKVPIVKNTEQWKIELLEPSHGKGLAQSQKGKSEVYSLLVTNKGKEVHNVHVGAFRNEPGSSKMFGLAPQMESALLNNEQTFKFENFPVKEGTKRLEIVITWEDEPLTLRDGSKASGRTYKDTVIFAPKN